jgi:ligand-binding sensor domain-containing protein
LKRSGQPSGILLLLIIIVINQTAFTQAPPVQFQHLSMEQGLSQNRLFAITQDKYGLIWIATEGGLNRFDGYKVESFRYERGNKNSLPNNMVQSLFTDSQGIVWIGTAHGLAYYDYQSNSFHSFFYSDKDENSLPSNVIWVINEDAHGILWIGTNLGLCSFDKKNRRFQRFVRDDHSNSISGNYINDIEFAPDGKMWITTSNGLNCLDLSTKKFISFFNDPNDSTTLSGNNLSRMAIDKFGNLWTSVYQTLTLECFDTKTYRTRHFTNFIEKQKHIPSNYLRDIFIDRSGRIWIGTNAAGLILFLHDKNVFYEYQADLLDQKKLQSNRIGGIFQDQSGMIWLSAFAGAERFNLDESKFILYRIPSNGSETLAYKSTRAIAEDSSYRLWIGTSNGVYILDRNKGTYLNYQWKRNDPYSLTDNDVFSLCRDRSGNMWVGTDWGLNLFDPVRKNFRKIYAQQDTFKGVSTINRIVSDKSGDLLICSSAGLSVYNFKNDSMYGLLNNATRTVWEDKHGILWIGTRTDGLIKYNRRTKEVERFTNSLDDTSSIAANFVLSITQDYSGKIWVGTISGLCRFDETTGKFSTFTEKNGLPDIYVTQLMVDDKNRIWMGTNKGISMLNESRTSFTNYDPSDGLQGHEFISGSAFKTHDGYFCYYGKNGFNLFHPDSIRTNKFKPPVTLKRIMIFDKALDIKSYADLKSLRLSYKQSFFSLEFAALNYDHPEKNQYAYQLIGFDKKRVELGTNRVINYTNVPPDNYTLKVWASNNDGVWNEAGFELKIVITPPFWATWWFKTIVVLVFIGAVFLFFKLRENRIKKEQARQTAINKQIAEIRMIALRGQMNPHFIFNSLNSIQHFITTRDKEEALNYLSKFSKLIRKILENSRENTVSISNEVQLLELYIQLEQLRFSNKFDYHIAIDEKIDMENTEIPPLLIQPYVENAILHGLINKNGKGDLWFSLERNNGLLICEIEDNGIGRARAQEIEQGKVSRHRSLGIKVTEERISGLFELLDYKMEVVTEDLFEIKQDPEEKPQPAGTRVIISIPVKEEE